MEDLDDIELLEQIEYIERRPRTIVRNRICDLDVLDEEAFRQRYRLSKDTVRMLTTMLSDQLKQATDRNGCLSPIEQILLTLRFYATGSFQEVIGGMGAVSQPTCCRMVSRVSKCLAELRPHFIHMPSTDLERLRVSREFFEMSGCPGVYGAIDCTHIAIQSPGGERAKTFRNQKGGYSINVQTVSDAKLFIRNIVASWPGATHDSTIFDNSYLKAQLEGGILPPSYLLVGDNAYACKKYILTPFVSPATEAEKRFNAAHTRARNAVVRQHSLWKRRFACLNYLRSSLQNSMTIIVATAVLHNFALQMGETEFDNELEINDKYIGNSQQNVTGIDKKECSCK